MGSPKKKPTDCASAIGAGLRSRGQTHGRLGGLEQRTARGRVGDVGPWAGATWGRGDRFQDMGGI